MKVCFRPLLCAAAAGIAGVAPAQQQIAEPTAVVQHFYDEDCSQPVGNASAIRG